MRSEELGDVRLSVEEGELVARVRLGGVVQACGERSRYDWVGRTGGYGGWDVSLDGLIVNLRVVQVRRMDEFWGPRKEFSEEDRERLTAMREAAGKPEPDPEYYAAQRAAVRHESGTERGVGLLTVRVRIDGDAKVSTGGALVLGITRGWVQVDTRQHDNLAFKIVVARPAPDYEERWRAKVARREADREQRRRVREEAQAAAEGLTMDEWRAKHAKQLRRSETRRLRRAEVKAAKAEGRAPRRKVRRDKRKKTTAAVPAAPVPEETPNVSEPSDLERRLSEAKELLGA